MKQSESSSIYLVATTTNAVHDRHEAVILLEISLIKGMGLKTELIYTVRCISE